ncbi:unnamed protein product [Rotaria sp. Silwood2]|nr:unnamed protein product [Rotaria sp. Silwood2]
MGIHSNTAIFGNVGIIAIGDFYQCSPVASSSIYSTLLWCDHFEYVELKINERQKTNASFSQMLNRIRKIKKKEDMSKEDRDMLEKCYQRFLNKEYHPEALHLFARNAQVDIHNEQMIEKICTNIRIFFEVNNNDKEIKANDKRETRKGGKPLRLAQNARVIITKNICVNDGIANGVTGRIVGFVENDNKGVSHIIIKCDLSKVGRLHRVTCPHCHEQNTICVIRESNTIDRLECDSQSKKGTKQFPLRLSWAMTIHKAQGITVDEVIISTKDLFGSGMGYTALSRVRTLEGLFLIDLHVNKFYCNENVDRVLSQMKVMKKKSLIFQESPQFLNILFHNIEGLKNNFNAFKNHHLTEKAHFICLTETWLRDNTNLNKFVINGYNLIHKSRLSSFSTSHPLNSQKGGGIATYIRETFPIKEIQSNKHLNLEHITFEIEKHNIVIITCYRSPQQSKNEFLINLTQYLKEIGIEKHIILIGDFNENTLSNKSKTIEKQLNILGFVNMFKDLATTNSLTSIDCIYSNFISNKDEHHSVVGTFYSFHDALSFCVNFENKISNVNVDNKLIVENEIETENLFEKILDVPQIPKKNYKRKTKSTERLQTHHHRRKLFKKDTNRTKCLKEKQILFLKNLKVIRDKNVLEKFSNELNLSQQLGNIGLKIINILADGNCFFRAVSHQLHRHERDHVNIRSIAIKYLIENGNEFEYFIDEQYTTIENYITRMSRNSTYADHLVILATAIVLNKNIIIHELGKMPILIPGSDFIEHQLHICYHPDTLHYDSVLSFDDNSAFLSTENILIT